MSKNRIALIGAIAVLCFAVPTAASAHEVREGGTILGTGAQWKVTTTNMTVLLGLGLLKCENLVVEGEVTKNSGGVVEAVGAGTGNATNCKIGANAAPVTDITVSLISANFAWTRIWLTFKSTILGIPCHFEGSGVSFTYASGTDVLKLTNGNLVGTPPATCEPGTTNVEFTHTTLNGTPLLWM